MKGWHNESMGHKLASKGVSFKAHGRKKMKPLTEITKLPFDYEKAGYDINNLLLIPELRQSKKHMQYHLQEYVDWLKSNDSRNKHGDDVHISIFFKDGPWVKYDMETYDPETKTISGWSYKGHKYDRKFNPDNTSQSMFFLLEYRKIYGIG